MLVRPLDGPNTFIYVHSMIFESMPSRTFAGFSARLRRMWGDDRAGLGRIEPSGSSDASQGDRTAGHAETGDGDDQGSSANAA